MNNQLIEWAQRNPWAITEQALGAIARILMAGDSQTIDANTLRTKGLVIEEAGPSARRSGAIAVIPIYGPTTKRASMLAQLFGLALPTYEGIAAMVREAASDPNVGSIVLDIDSPGGNVDGVEEVSNAIFEARKQKPIVAVANSMMASAAYDYGSAAHEIVAAPDALVGSIGVYALHLDFTKAAEMEGIKPTLVSAGQFKTEGHPLEPLSDDAMARMKEIVDARYSAMVGRIARNRGVSAAAVRKDFGEGRVQMANEAKASGMIDRVATLGDTLRRMGGTQPAARGMAAEADPLLAKLEPDPDSEIPGVVEETRADILEAANAEGRTLTAEEVRAMEDMSAPNERERHRLRMAMLGKR